MNAVTLFGLLITTYLRAMGFIVALDLYFAARLRRYILAMVGWALQTLASIFPIMADLVPLSWLQRTFLVLNVSCAFAGTLSLLIVVFDYFLDVLKPRMKKTGLLIAGGFVIFLLTSFIDLDLASNCLSVSLLAIMCIALGYIVKNWRQLKERFGRSIWWLAGVMGYFFAGYLPVSLYIMFTSEAYGLYDTFNDTMSILNYTTLVIATFLMVLMQVHFEYNISRRNKDSLKDKYSHDLGNMLQVLISTESLLRDKRLEARKDELIDLIDRKIKEVSDLLQRIREL